MKIFDISQEVFTSQPYPGDPAPEKRQLTSIADGDEYNLTAFSMCAHNGTHVDAPYHFQQQGKKIGELPLEIFIGKAYVATVRDTLTEREAVSILNQAEKASPQARLRILLKGSSTISLQAAAAFAKSGILLLGTELPTFGSEDETAEIHRLLLKNGVCLLEGVRMANVSDGVYNLCAAPLNLGEAEGAPCRAVLMQ